MPGQHITDEQRRKFMKHLTEEKLSVETAAAKSGVSRRMGFRIKNERAELQVASRHGRKKGGDEEKTGQTCEIRYREQLEGSDLEN